MIGACDDTLAELTAQHRHPVPKREMTVRDAFNRAGAEKWGAFRTQFRDQNVKKAAD